MKNNNKVLSLLGLATKAGKIASGEFSTEKSVKSGKGFLVLVAATHPKIQKKKIPVNIGVEILRSTGIFPRG